MVRRSGFVLPNQEFAKGALTGVVSRASGGLLQRQDFHEVAYLSIVCLLGSLLLSCIPFALLRAIS